MTLHQVSDKAPMLKDIILQNEILIEQYPDDFALKLSLDSLKAHREEIKKNCPYRSETNYCHCEEEEGQWTRGDYCAPEHPLQWCAYFGGD